MIQNDAHFKIFVRSRQLEKSTQEEYVSALKKYCSFLNKTPTELIESAEKEEEARLRMKHRKIKTNLIDFTEYLLSQKYSVSYTKKVVSLIRTFYREFEIELPHSIHLKNKEQFLITTDNMICKDHIKTALSFSNLKYKAIILLTSSSGMGASEVVNLTFNDLLGALEINEKKVIPVNELEQIFDKRSEYALIPTWRIKRYKTKKPYFTFSSPESTRAILNYLREREYNDIYPVELSDWLFVNSYADKINKIKNNILGMEFTRINDRCGFGHQGNWSFFRSHNLRKFFATTLQKNGLQQIITDWLLGHKLNAVTGAYFKPDILAVKKEYMKALPDLSLEKTEIKDIHSKEYEDILGRLKSVEAELKLHKELKGLDKSK